MILRPAFPDELSRARALLDGYPVPTSAAFLLVVREQPVERILMAIPWWTLPGRDDRPAHLRFFLAGPSSVAGESLDLVLAKLEAIASEQKVDALFTDFSIPSEHALYHELSFRGFEIAQTDRCFSVPGELANQRGAALYRRVTGKIPSTWKVESIRGYAPEEIFALVSAHRLMSLHQFQSYWNTANREHFEEKYSCVVLDEGQIIGVFLVTRREESELHVHVDAVSSERKAASGLITIAMRHFTRSACAEGFPERYTSRADSAKHREGGNSPLRHGGTELAPWHFLKKDISTASGNPSVTLPIFKHPQ